MADELEQLLNALRLGSDILNGELSSADKEVSSAKTRRRARFLCSRSSSAATATAYCTNVCTAQCSSCRRRAVAAPRRSTRLGSRHCFAVGCVRRDGKETAPRASPLDR